VAAESVTAIGGGDADGTTSTLDSLDGEMTDDGEGSTFLVRLGDVDSSSSSWRGLGDGRLMSSVDFSASTIVSVSFGLRCV